jgi:ribosomal protein L24
LSGINMVKRHQRQTPNQEGGIITKEASITFRTWLLRDPKDGKPTRVGFRMEGDTQGARRQTFGRSDRWLSKIRARLKKQLTSHSQAAAGRVFLRKNEMQIPRVDEDRRQHGRWRSNGRLQEAGFGG